MKDVISKYFSKADLKNIETELELVEAKTAAEFVIVVARASTSPGLMLPFLWTVFGAVLWYVSEVMPVMPQLWDALDSWLRDGIIIAISFVLAQLAFRDPRIRRVLTPDADERKAVDEQAELQFYRRRVNQTSGQAGVLLYLSLLERRAVILADQNAHKVLDQARLNSSIEELLNSVHKGETSSGIIKILRDFGDRLHTSLPAPEKKSNELPNALIFI